MSPSWAMMTFVKNFLVSAPETNLRIIPSGHILKGKVSLNNSVVVPKRTYYVGDDLALLNTTC